MGIGIIILTAILSLLGVGCLLTTIGYAIKRFPKERGIGKIILFNYEVLGVFILTILTTYPIVGLIIYFAYTVRK